MEGSKSPSFKQLTGIEIEIEIDIRYYLSKTMKSETNVLER